MLSWDVRALSGHDPRDGRKHRPVCGLRSYARGGAGTNQRLQFDVDGDGRRIFVGSGEDGDGAVRIYDVKGGSLEGSVDVGCGDDAVNGVSFFDLPGNGAEGGKRYGILSVAVGSRRFPNIDTDEEDAVETDDGRARVPGFIQFHTLKEFSNE